LAIRTIVAHKGLELVILKVAEFCSFADYFVICSGGSHRHVQALAQHVEEALSQAGLKPLGVEGREEGQWVLMDYNIMVIHIFLEPLREFYNLEDLWSDAPKIQIDVDNYPLQVSHSPQEPVSAAETDTEPIHHE
jgi:ribosome-associated protein